MNMYLSVLVVLICDKDGYKWNSLSIKCLHTTVSTPLLCLKRDDIFFLRPASEGNMSVAPPARQKP